MKKRNKELLWRMFMILGLALAYHLYVSENDDNGRSFLEEVSDVNILSKGNIPDWGPGSGGGSSITQPEAGGYVSDVMLCTEFEDGPDCHNDTALRPHNDLHIFWLVREGVGCCHGYGCNYNSFYAHCIYPEFKLYDFYFDGEKHDWVKQNMSKNYHYNCSVHTPWNWFNIQNVSIGEHSFTIEHKDCSDEVVFTKTYHVNVARAGEYFKVELV